ncbi:MAG: recombination regulator RecX [Rhodocyclaceae bacterium]|nr:recombination regulator RecX [Rhodocyclaceae bacterium]MBX3668729.1 recombination regulator RecX [Rhodocyclaceae bacterium]
MPALRTRALRMIAQREHSRAELARKLAAHGEPDEIVSLLDALAADGYLSDTRYAESYVAARASRLGDLRLAHELEQRGVNAEAIEQALASTESETARLKKIWQSRFGKPPGDRTEWARQARFLQARGFTHDRIRALLRDPASAEDEAQ